MFNVGCFDETISQNKMLCFIIKPFFPYSLLIGGAKRLLIFDTLIGDTLTLFAEKIPEISWFW